MFLRFSVKHAVPHFHGCHHHCQTSHKKHSKGFVPSSLTGHTVPAGTKSVLRITLQHPRDSPLVRSLCLDLVHSLSHTLCRVQIIWRGRWRAGTITCQDYCCPVAGEPGNIVTLSMLAASSFPINIRDGGVALRESEPDAAPTPAACMTTRGCFRCRGTSTGTCTSPTLTVGGNFVGGAFPDSFLASHPLLRSPSLLAASTLPCVLPPLAFSLPARLPMFLRLSLRQACPVMAHSFCPVNLMW